MRDHSRRRSAVTVPRAVRILIVLLTACVAAAAHAGQVVPFHWTASPLKAADGTPLPAVVAYEVWVTVDAEPESMIAAVPDTFYYLSMTSGCTYRLRVRAVDEGGNKSAMSEFSDPFKSGGTSAVPAAAPAELGPVYPNPFNPATTITYRVPDDLAAGAAVSLDIIGLQGRRVCRLAVERQPGEHQIVWHGVDSAGRGVPAGIYLAQFVCGTQRATRKMSLVR